MWPRPRGPWLGGHVEARVGLCLTLGVGGSSGSDALPASVPSLCPQGPDWVGGCALWRGSRLGVWAVWGLSDSCWLEGLGASRPRPHSERSKGLSGAWSCVAVSSLPLGLPGPVRCGCCPPGRVAPATLPSGPSESEPTRGEGGVSRGPCSLAPLACPRALSCWARSRCSAPSSRGSRMSTRAPGRPGRPVGSSQASVSPAFRPWGWGLPMAVSGARGLMRGL